MKRRTVLALACGPSAVAVAGWLLVSTVTRMLPVGEVLADAVVLAVLAFPVGLVTLLVAALVQYLRGRS